MSEALLRSLQSQLSECLPVDKAQLLRRLQGVQRLPANKQTAVLAIIGQELEKAKLRAQLRQQNVPKLHYPDLPVTDKRHDIAEAIRKHQVVIVAGETGSGKTTQLPKICMEAGRGVQGMIGHTQPRRYRPIR